MRAALLLALLAAAPPVKAPVDIVTAGFQRYEVRAGARLLRRFDPVQYVAVARSDAAPSRAATRVLLEVADGGEACPLSYALVTLRPAPARITPLFGECGELRGVAWHARDVTVTVAGNDGPVRFRVDAAGATRLR